jgi:hypothetical protein
MSSTNKNSKTSKNNKTVTNVLSTKVFSSTTNPALSTNSVLEINTLSKIIDLSKQCNKFLDSLQASRRQVLLDIKNNENDFFDKNPHLVTQFNALFDPTIFQSKVDMFLNELKDTVDTYCCHDYIEDLIDVGYDQSRRVVYCQLCELTKK